MAKPTRAPKILNTALRIVIRGYLTRRFNLTVVGKGIKGIDELKSPYLIVANHTNFWDPFFVASFVPKPIHFVTADEYFRNPLVKAALRLVGAIPKSKFIADFDTVKSILKVKKAGGIIGVFPEGRRNWDGGPEPVVYSTAKLIKALKLPVVTALLKGAHLSKPRWAKKPRRGLVSVTYNVLLTPEEIAKFTADEIYKRVVSGLDYHEYAFQAKEMIRYKGRRLAENLELFLFTCPQCRKIGTMKSERNDFFCSTCGYHVSYDKYGFFQSRSGDKLSFRNPKEWNQWQLALLQNQIASAKKGSPVIFEDRLVFLLQGSRLKPLKKIHTGRLQLPADSLLFTNLQGEKIRFDFAQISGLNVQQNDKLEFYYQNMLYRFIFQPRVSAYKWLKGIELLQVGTGKPEQNLFPINQTLSIGT